MDCMRDGTHVSRAGRHAYARGEEHPNSKLTTPQREEIKARRAAGTLLRVLAAEFGVTKTTICRLGK